MLRILYPESRMVSEETVIGWAVDELINARIDAGEFADDEDGTKLAAAIVSNPPLTLEDAKALLEDRGAVTFAR